MAKDLALDDGSAASAASLVDEETEQLNLELYFRLTFFKGSDEKMIRIFDTSYLTFGDAKELCDIHCSTPCTCSVMVIDTFCCYRSITIVLSTVAIYLLRNHTRPGKDYSSISSLSCSSELIDSLSSFSSSSSALGYALLTSFPITKISQLMMALFFQYVRVELDPNTAFVFLFRSCKESDKFVALVKAAAKISGHHLGAHCFDGFHLTMTRIMVYLLLDVLNKNREVLSNLEGIIGKQRVELYLLLHLRVKSSGIIFSTPENTSRPLILLPLI